MKRLTQLLLLMVVSMGAAQAQLPESFYTNGEINGHYWQASSTDKKLGFLYGFLEGVYDGAGSSIESVRVYFTATSTYGDSFLALDKLYAQPENLIVPVSYGLYLFRKQCQGESSDVINDSLAKFRKEVNKQAAAQAAK